MDNSVQERLTSIEDLAKNMTQSGSNQTSGTSEQPGSNLQYVSNQKSGTGEQSGSNLQSVSNQKPGTIQEPTPQVLPQEQSSRINNSVIQQDLPVNPSENVPVQQVQNRPIQPPENASVQQKESTLIQPAENVTVYPSKDTPIQPAENTSTQSIGNTTVYLSKNAPTQPVESDLKQPTENTPIQPIKSFPQIIPEPSINLQKQTGEIPTNAPTTDTVPEIVINKSTILNYQIENVQQIMTPNTISIILHDKNGNPIQKAVAMVKTASGAIIQAKVSDERGQILISKQLENGIYFVEIQSQGHTIPRVRYEMEGLIFKTILIRES